MPESRPSFLTNAEREVVANMPELNKVRILSNIEKLAATLQSPDILVQGIHQASPEQVRKLGHKVDGVLKLLALMTPEEEITVEEQQTVEPVVAYEPTPQKSEIKHTKFPQSFFDFKLLTLTDETELPEYNEEKYDEIIANLIMLRALPRVGKRTWDWPAVLRDLIAGDSYNQLAEKYNKTNSNVVMVTMNYFRHVKANLPPNFTLSMLLEPMEPIIKQPEEVIEASASVISVNHEEVSEPVVPKPTPRPAAVLVKEPIVIEPVDQALQKIKEYETTLALAIESTSKVNVHEWEEAAYATLSRLAESYKIKPHEVDQLWQRMHYGRSIEYRAEPTPTQLKILKQLKSLYVARTGSLKHPDNKLQNTAVRNFLNLSTGTRTLDDVAANVRQGNPHITVAMSERLLVDGIIKLLDVERTPQL